MKKAILLIIDGLGIPQEGDISALSRDSAPFFYWLKDNYPACALKSSGEYVGLPKSLMGNSEVGHLNIGAGRIVYQNLGRITKAIEDGSFFENESLMGAMAHARRNNSSLHIMGLISDGGVHSMDSHCLALVKMAKEQEVENVYVHAFLDGRDTPPQSGLGYMQKLLEGIGDDALIASLSGRYYAMDRDMRWARVKSAYECIAGEVGAPSAADALAYIKSSYSQGITDEFILPTQILDSNGALHPLKSGDSVVFFNFRPDRARELSRAIMEDEFAGFDRKKLESIYFSTFVEYSASFGFASPAFSDEKLANGLGEYISALGLSQLRIAETEKYAHVTYFLNGGVEPPFEKEDRKLVPSPQVDTYDLMPEMSVYEVTSELVEAIGTGKYDLIVANFANCDMVGHTGIIAAATQAVSHVDRCIEATVRAGQLNSYEILVAADHGNCEKMVLAGQPHTAHTTNDVYMVAASNSVASLSDGRLCDIAPTVLAMMGLNAPDEMNGINLAKFGL
ncbi:MAG: 2,3-bisphosphoglycerate-independent phosphoglycerate mutase [Eubacteriaceae bacterium]|nr:2,3-bisphosphoglycerate-independent phosphoglycerate mutase [Eubacteriaceae bacterium]